MLRDGLPHNHAVDAARRRPLLSRQPGRRGDHMAPRKVTFNQLLAHYPIDADAFGAGGRLVDNPAYAHTCALRLSTALETAAPGFLSEFGGNTAVHLQGAPGHYRRVPMPYARGARALADYLRGAHVGWPHRRLATRAEALALGTQGIIFWKVEPGSGSPNHIDLWDPRLRALRAVGGRTMLWAPASDIVEYALFWELPRGGAFTSAPLPHPMRTGP
jgi:hypothetical protein